MSEGSSLININLGNVGDLSKTLTVFVEKISDAVGEFFKPLQMKRVARAEAEVALIKANAQVQITEIEQRALLRLVREEGKKQENIEAIARKAIDHVKDDAQPESMEQDWLVHFFERCRLTSDEEMQNLWAGILAGQANHPGSFSKRTIEIVSLLDKSDAVLFKKLCTFVWMIGSAPTVILMNSEMFQRHGITFSNLSHLDDIGLITFDNMAGFLLQGLKKNESFFYYGRQINNEFPHETNNLTTGKAILTRAGHELVSICGSEASDVYLSDMLGIWKSKGLIIK